MADPVTPEEEEAIKSGEEMKNEGGGPIDMLSILNEPDEPEESTKPQKPVSLDEWHKRNIEATRARAGEVPATGGAGTGQSSNETPSETANRLRDEKNQRLTRTNLGAIPKKGYFGPGRGS